MRLLALAGDVQALIAEIRLLTPLRALCAERGWTLAVRNFHDCRRADLDAADVLVVQRGASAPVLRLQRAMRRRGGAVVYEIDDLLTEIAPHISNHGAVMARQRWLRRCMAECDVLSVSTDRLGVMLAETTGLPAPVVVVPNHAPPASLAALPAQGPGPVTLLFASSDRLAAGYLWPALRALQGDGVQIVVVGPPGEAFQAAGIAVRREPLRPREAFLALARSLPNPVGVIPLEASRFAAGKSAIKWFDYAETGLPTLASSVPPYADVMTHGRTGWLVDNTPEAWQQALQAVIADPAARRQVAGAAQQAVRRAFGVDRTVAAWGHAVAQAVQSRAGAAVPAAGWRDGLADRLDDALATLRRLNRARLARRRPR